MRCVEYGQEEVRSFVLHDTLQGIQGLQGRPMEHTRPAGVQCGENKGEQLLLVLWQRDGAFEADERSRFSEEQRRSQRHGQHYHGLQNVQLFEGQHGFV